MTDTINHEKSLDSPVQVSANLMGRPILFFDGECGLCDASVNWFLTRDRRQILSFAPLQGKTAAKYLPSEAIESLESVVLFDKQGLHRRSSAIVRALGYLGGHYRLYSWLLWLIPKPIREVGYRVVARLRYRIFGKRESCRMPTQEERGRIFP